MAIKIVGRCFPVGDPQAFLAYLKSVKFTPGGFKPEYVTVHHTGGPDLKTWSGWQTRPKPVTDEQWLINLAGYYGSSPANGGPGDGPWQHGPHFMFTPKHWCVLSLPNERGTHAKSFNANSWSVEMVGEFDTERLTGQLLQDYCAGIALLHIALDLPLLPYQFKKSGLHFHRDDPLTSKTCPGKSIEKAALIKEISRFISTPDTAKEQGDDHEEPISVVVIPHKATGVVIDVASNDTLSVRASASAKAPRVTGLKNGAPVTITGEAMNGTTKWLSVDLPGDDDGWVAARYIRRT